MNRAINGTAASLAILLAATAASAAENEGEPGTAGILPIPDYTGSFSERTHLFGDLGGARTRWAEKGFQFDVEFLNWTDSILNGGLDSDTHVGGNLTYNIEIDLMRAGLIPGALIQIRGETRYGESGNLSFGQIVPTNTAALSPTNYSAIDDGYDIALTQLTYLQLFSEKFGVIAGKFDLYGNGDPNEFATGRGHTQFNHWSLNVGTSNLVIPASTVGVGVIINPNKRFNITSLLLSGTECTDSNCFDDLDEKGGVFLTSATYQYSFNGLPGGVAGAVAYLFDKDFTKLDSVTFVPNEGLVTSTENDSWTLGGSFWQYLWTKETHEGPLNLMNREADLQGWGIFGRLTFADDDTNPWKTAVALGLGGRGIFDARPDDTFGVGYFYNDLSEGRFLDEVDDGYGFEAFYNFAITPAVRFSTNLQYVSSGFSGIDDTFALSTRLQLRF